MDTQTRKTRTRIAAALLILLLSGSTESLDIQGSIRVSNSRTPGLHEQARISLTEAIAIASSEIQGQAIEAELDTEGGYLVYEVEIVQPAGNRTEVLVDAGNGKILGLEKEAEEDEEEAKEDDDEEEENHREAFKDAPGGSIPIGRSQKNLHRLAKLSISEAQKTALAARPGIIIEAELERESGYLVYSIEIADSRDRIFEVIVDAGNGQILKITPEND